MDVTMSYVIEPKKIIRWQIWFRKINDKIVSKSISEKKHLPIKKYLSISLCYSFGSSFLRKRKISTWKNQNLSSIFFFFIILKSIMHSVKFLACFSKTRLKSHSINLIYDITHILGIYFSWNGKLTLEKNFLNHIVKIQNILKSWKLRDAGRVILFKSMRLLLTKIQMEFISKGKNPKIKSSALFND